MLGVSDKCLERLLTKHKVRGLAKRERARASRGGLQSEPFPSVPNRRPAQALEIGCGTGTTALRLGPCCGHLVATDVSPEMIAIARKKLAAAPQPSLEFQVADADAPVFGEACHDVVVAFNVLHLVSDLDAALTSALSALAPGGLLISKTPCLSDMSPLISRVLLPVMRMLGKAPPVLCFRAADLQAAMVRHGLEILAVEHHGSKRKDHRPFIVARKRGPADG